MMNLPQVNGFKWSEIIPYTDLDMLEGVDGYPQNLITYDQTMASARLLATNRFKWESDEIQPKKQLSEYIEKLLFIKGQCALFKESDGWKVKCCVPTGGINEYGQPSSFTLTDYNGNGTVTVDIDDERFIWIKNNNDCIPTIFWILKYCNRVAKIERTMDLNIDAQKTPYVIETSPEVHLSIQNIFKQIRAMDEVVYVDQKTGIKDNVKVLDLNAPYLVDQLYSQKVNEYNDLLNFLGLNTVKEKRERLLYDEARISDEITDSYLDMFARPRVLAYREMKEKGINIKLLELKVDNDMDAVNVSDTGDENNEQNNQPVEVTENTNNKELK